MFGDYYINNKWSKDLVEQIFGRGITSGGRTWVTKQRSTHVLPGWVAFPLLKLPLCPLQPLCAHTAYIRCLIFYGFKYHGPAPPHTSRYDIHSKSANVLWGMGRLSPRNKGSLVSFKCQYWLFWVPRAGFSVPAHSDRVLFNSFWVQASVKFTIFSGNSNMQPGLRLSKLEGKQSCKPGLAKT